MVAEEQDRRFGAGPFWVRLPDLRAGVPYRLPADSFAPLTKRPEDTKSCPRAQRAAHVMRLQEHETEGACQCQGTV